MKISTLTAILLVSLIVVVPVVSQELSKAPNFNLKTADGKTVELAKQKAKVVVLNFWATWCGPCKAEIPGFNELYEKYRTKGLEIIGISLDDDGWSAIKPFVENVKVSYPIVLGDGELAEAYGGIEAIPTTFILDKKGKILNRHLGYLSKDDFEKILKPLL